MMHRAPSPHRSEIARLAPLARLLAAAAVACGAVLLAGCGGQGGPPPDIAIDVAVTRPEVTLVEDTLPAVGTIEPDERVVIQPEVPGLIQSIHFAEGQRVAQGEVLFRLDSRKEEAQVAQALAEKDLARANLERALTLAKTKAISQQELDQMESTLASKTATHDLESRRLEDRILRAPFAGTLGPRDVSVGQHVTAGTPLVTLVEDARVKVEFRLPERQLGQVRLGQPARLRVSAFPGESFEGSVDLVDPEVDPATRTLRARLLVPNPDRRLRPGMFARVELIAGRRPDALVVPESALVPSLDEFGVYVVNEGRARFRVVKLGVRLPGKVELLKGLDPESEVIISGTQKVVDGIRVKPSRDVAPTVAAVAAAPPTGEPAATPH